MYQNMRFKIIYMYFYKKQKTKQYTYTKSWQMYNKYT